MSADNMERFRSVFGAVLGVPPDRVDDAVTADATDTWDSLNHITLVMSLEESFGVKFSTREVMGWKNVGEMLDTLVTRAT